MKKIFTLAAAFVAMISCSENLENTPATPETDKLPINISTTLTRATDSAFEQGDKVGIFVVNEPNSLAASGNHADNTSFTYAGSTWNPDTPIYWLDQTTKADFYCYYPYAESVSTTAHSFVTKADQSTLENYKSSEFLWGTTAQWAVDVPKPQKLFNHERKNRVIRPLCGPGFRGRGLSSLEAGACPQEFDLHDR